jgi:hypothetical protein
MRCPNGTRRNVKTGKCEEKKLKNNSRRRNIKRNQIMFECIVYEYGGGIFNRDDQPKMYRTDVNIKYKFTCTMDDIFERKNPKEKIIYFYKKGKRKPMINTYFVSQASMNRFMKENKEMLLEKFGRLGYDYFVEGCLLSELDSRAEEEL